MKNTYQISRVAVTLPSLGQVTHDDQGNAINIGEKYRIHLYAVQPGWEQSGTFDGFMIGYAAGVGNSQSEHTITCDVIAPDGYKIIALHIGDNNKPITWESLPVMFVGGHLSTPDGGKVESVYYVKGRTGQDGKQYTAGMAIGVDAATTKTRLSDDTRNAVIDAVRDSKLFVELEPQKQAVFQAEQFTVANGEVRIAGAVVSETPATTEQLSSNVINVNFNTQCSDEALSEAIAKAIKLSLRPGGLIHGSIRQR